MHRPNVAFAIQAPEQVARERVRSVLRFYDPCGELEVRVRRHGALNLTVGELLIGDARIADATGDGAIVSAGEPLPASLSGSLDLLDASDAQLRALDGAQAAVAARDGRARLVAGAGATRTWFQSGDAYATTIAASALLGAAAPLVDADSLPEMLVLGTCLGQRTHLRDVRSLPPSTVVDFGAGEHESWPRLARWAQAEPAEAANQAWKALLMAVDSRLDGERSPWVLLDDCGDAVVLLAAASELGIDIRVFGESTEDGTPKPTTTVAAARALALRDALLGDGVQPLSPFAAVGPPRTASCVLTGAGGQIARGTGHPTRLLAETPADHRPAIEIKLREWFEEAAASGPNPWSATDMLLIEERIGETGPLPAPPFATREPWRSPEVARALSSLTPEVRATRRWHQRALGDFEVPAHAGAKPDYGWERLPEIREWLIEEPLSHPLLNTALGDLWVQRLKDDVGKPEPGAARLALTAAAAVIFEQRLQTAARPPPDRAQSAP